MSFLAFGVTVLAAGWRWGDPVPGGTLELSASGAAFAAIVIGQLTNAFLCRSSTVSIRTVGWTTNRFLLVAVGAEVIITGSFIFVPVIADAMDQAPPTAAGWVVALAACPTMVVVDSVEKCFHRRRRLQAQELHDAVVPAGGVAAVHGDGLPGHERRVV
jgi:magnesium-transporting ATPase (P-type)